MSIWTPNWRIKIEGTEYTGVALADLTITSGRTDIYSQPVAGYCRLNLINTDQSQIDIEINDGLTVEVQNDAGTWVVLFGGSITDVEVGVSSAGAVGMTQTISLTALGALARLTKAVFEGNIAQDTDGAQIQAILEGVLFASWNEVPAATQWQTYDATTTWANAENSGLGQIDVGDYDLDSQSGVVSDVYSLVASLAQSGLGYLYESPNGQINYADSTHRSEYLAANGYVGLTAHHALSGNVKSRTRAGDVRNSVTLSYTTSGNSTVTDSDAASIALYGQLAQTIRTYLKNQSDAEAQAAFYLLIRAYPQAVFDSITFAIGNPEIDEADRANLLGVFMGMPIDLIDLPANMQGGAFQGFVEGWTFQATVKDIKVTLIVSPVAYSLQAFRWNGVPVTETWNTISATLDWLNATIVA